MRQVSFWLHMKPQSSLDLAQIHRQKIPVVTVLELPTFQTLTDILLECQLLMWVSEVKFVVLYITVIELFTVPNY
jgi:hypothetical protein